ncbi:MAG: hypothetical protein JRI98_09180 [Deltaproteobacteria bacterium]|nr:hypothetical protein [Deltaproteobacteria bacterium]
MGWTSKNIILCSIVHVMLGVLLAGCQVDSDDVQQWNGSDRYPLELRTEAALAIVEMDRNDVDALALLKGALDDLRGEDAAASEAIVGGMIPRLEALLSEESEPRCARRMQRTWSFPTLQRRFGTPSFVPSWDGIPPTSKDVASPATTVQSR